MWSTGKRSASYLVIVICSALLSCSPLVSFDYLDVSCSVSEGERYYDGENLRLEFSIEPDQGEVERTLVLSEGDLSTAPVFSWEGGELSVRPRGGWKKGEHYRVSLEGRIHTRDGRGYTTRLLRSFIYGTEGEEFTLVSSALEEGGLLLQFSKAPLESSFTENFSVRPDTEYFCDFAGKTVRVQPKSPWQLNTRYTWTVKGIASVDGYTMKREYSSSFSGPDDSELPRVLELCPVLKGPEPGSLHLWKRGAALEPENGEGIGFVFSKPMDPASLRSGISLYPAIKGYFEEAGAEAIVFFPEEDYRPETEYRVTLSSAIKDSLGLGLFEEQRYYFSSARRYLDVEKLSLDSNSRALEPGGIPQDHALQRVTIDGVEAAPGLELLVAFSQAIPPAGRRAAADSVSLSVLFPASVGNPTCVAVQWSDGGALLCMRYTGLSPSTGSIDNYYQIRILSGESGPLGVSGDYLKEDLWYVIRIY